MEPKDWLLLIVPTVVSFIGFWVTCVKIRTEFSYSVIAKNYEVMSEKCFELFEVVNQINEYPDKVYDSEIIDKLLEYKIFLKIYGTNNLYKSYRKYGTYIWKINESFTKYKSQSQESLYEYDMDGNMIFDSSMDPVNQDKYIQQLEEFKSMNKPSTKSLTRNSKRLLKTIRKELYIK